MGRSRIIIQKIEEQDKRIIAFAKRKEGLINKAYEISILCDAEVLLILFSTGGKLFLYEGKKRADETLRRLIELPIEQRGRLGDENLIRQLIARMSGEYKVYRQLTLPRYANGGNLENEENLRQGIKKETQITEARMAHIDKRLSVYLREVHDIKTWNELQEYKEILLQTLKNCQIRWGVLNCEGGIPHNIERPTQEVQYATASSFNNLPSSWPSSSYRNQSPQIGSGNIVGSSHFSNRNFEVGSSSRTAGHNGGFSRFEVGSSSRGAGCNVGSNQYENFAPQIGSSSRGLAGSSHFGNLIPQIGSSSREANTASTSNFGNLIGQIDSSSGEANIASPSHYGNLIPQIGSSSKVPNIATSSQFGNFIPQICSSSSEANIASNFVNWSPQIVSSSSVVGPSSSQFHSLRYQDQNTQYSSGLPTGSGHQNAADQTNKGGWPYLNPEQPQPASLPQSETAASIVLRNPNSESSTHQGPSRQGAMSLPTSAARGNELVTSSFPREEPHPAGFLGPSPENQILFEEFVNDYMPSLDMDSLQQPALEVQHGHDQGFLQAFLNDEDLMEGYFNNEELTLDGQIGQPTSESITLRTQKGSEAPSRGQQGRLSLSPTYPSVVNNPANISHQLFNTDQPSSSGIRAEEGTSSRGAEGKGKEVINPGGDN